MTSQIFEIFDVINALYTTVLIKRFYIKLFLNGFILMKTSRKYFDEILIFIKFVIFIALLHYTLLFFLQEPVAEAECSDFYLMFQAQ